MATKWKKSPPTLVELFNEVVPGSAESRKMFGYPAAFVNGNMVMGLHEDRMILRLPEESREELLKIRGAATFEPMPGRPMREYTVVPPSILGNRAKLSGWVARALAYGASLQPKKSAKKKKGR